MVNALDEDPGLSKIAGYAADSGEGRWTVEAGIEHGVATPAITAALYARFVSRQDDSPTMKAVAAMRNQFGGHAVRSSAPKGGDAEGATGAEQSETSKKAGAGSGQEPGES
jgi:6-phosphogluconate dehydrogenase